MKDKKTLSRNAFDLQATTYDTDKNGEHARTLYPHITDRLSDIPFNTVLDVGCGTGEILNTIKNRFPAVSLYGIDISEEMLALHYNDVMKNAYMGDKLAGIIPCMSIYEFLDKLKEEE